MGAVVCERVLELTRCEVCVQASRSCWKPRIRPLRACNRPAGVSHPASSLALPVSMGAWGVFPQAPCWHTREIFVTDPCVCAGCARAEKAARIKQARDEAHHEVQQYQAQLDAQLQDAMSTGVCFLKVCTRCLRVIVFMCLQTCLLAGC